MGAYPPLLNLDADTEQSLLTFLNDEVTRHMADRQTFIQDLLNMQKDYWAEPSM